MDNVYHIWWPLQFRWLLLHSLYKEDYLQILKYVFFSVNGEIERL